MGLETEKIELQYLQCDKCGAEYEDIKGICLFTEDENVELKAINDNWIVSENADYYCPNCAEIVEEVHYRIKFKNQA